MMNLAMAILDGNLVADPEIRETKTGKKVCQFSIAMNHEWGNKDGNSSVSFIQIEAWERLGENCNQYLSKGSRVTIQGNIRQDRWVDQEGKTRSRIKIVANSVRFDSTGKSQTDPSVNMEEKQQVA